MLSKLKKEEKVLQETVGRKLMLVEKTGRQLCNILVKKDPWKGGDCQRSDCFVCEPVGNNNRCRQRNIIYVNECRICVKEGRRRSLYLGESCRSLKERLHEHYTDVKVKEDCHIASHSQVVTC